jgi:hypothetical protein
MQKQIEKALEKFESMKGRQKEEFRSILKKYLEGDIKLDEAYYLLLEGELIPMPSRCGLYAKVEPQGEDELKSKIAKVISR